MRTSKRDRIITGALELAHRDGFDALTFDALAEHVGLTRGGVIYHFRTKTELLEGIAVAFQERWRAEALEALGKAPGGGEPHRAHRGPGALRPRWRDPPRRGQLHSLVHAAGRDDQERLGHAA